MQENERSDMLTEVDRIVNRHKARLLDELEGGNCPVVFLRAVKGAIDWMRSDLNELGKCKEMKDEQAGNAAQG